ncbi:MAG: hypothetical protein K2H87_01930 [Duncaniella sp.]|nr:hypothetical protein [Duncaniella sp.]
MNAQGFFKSNGRAAGDSGVMPGLFAISPEHVTLSVEYSQTNAWLVSFSAGHVNGNNKYNGYSVAAVVALEEDSVEGWIEAYHKCCQKKKGAPDCVGFRVDYERELVELIGEVYGGTYRPSPGKSFVVLHPCPREIITAEFRDRIVQTWIAMRIEPLLEERFTAQGNLSHNCRKGFGLDSAIRALSGSIDRARARLGADAWVAKVDVKAFFASIDTVRLWGLLEGFIAGRYRGPERELLLRLTEMTVLHRPHIGARQVSPPALYDRVPPHKRLCNAPEGIGLAPGNLISQLLANFYMSFVAGNLAESCARNGCEPPVEYVDDFAFAGPKDGLLRVIADARGILADYGLTLHPDKVYLQPATHGIRFVGRVVKPGRIYTASRTLGSLSDALAATCAICRRIRDGDVSIDALAALRGSLSTLNSLLGTTRRTASRNMRERIFGRADPAFFDVCYTRGSWESAHPKEQYKLINKLLEIELNNGLALYPTGTRKGRHGAARRSAPQDNQLSHRAASRG